MDIKPIAVIVNDISQAGDANWARVRSEIRVNPELARGLVGLDQFSHAVIVYLMHEAEFSLDSHLVRRPRDRADMPLVGIFAQRARHRPNLIGVSTVAIDTVRAGSLFVRGLD